MSTTTIETMLAGNEPLLERTGLISHKLKFSESKPSVLIVRDLESLLPADGFLTELVELAGGQVEIEFTADPDIIVVAPLDQPMSKTLGQMSLLTAMNGWDELKAVTEGRVYIADGIRFFHREPDQLADTAELLAEVIHPKQFVFGLEGTGWLKFSSL